jgi:threonylcarbamoyladenosine tRNA methylthiotransferase MtaB
LNFYIKTLGCKTNQYESDRLARELILKGWKKVTEEDNPDVCIVNTCTVTKQADRKSRQMLRKLISKNPDSKIIAIGCYVNRDKKELEDINGVFCVFPNEKKPDLQDILEDILQKSKGLNFNINRKRLNNIRSSKTKTKFLDFSSHTRGLVKIEDGCDNFCSYCIVPYVRGKPISRNKDEIIEEINYLCSEGVKEIILTGINIGLYGKDSKNKKNLTNLIEEILEKTKIFRIRLSSIEINDVSSSLVDLISQNSRLCPHLHIPLQSGSSKILKMMKRGYNIKQFIKKINKIRSKIPKIAITTDLIVGFPGEKEADFKASLKAMKKINFSKVHVFKYSDRPGTLAEKMDNKIFAKVKKARSKKALELANELRKEYLISNIGKRVNVLVEKVYKENNLRKGTSENYIRVSFKDDISKKGDIVNVLLEGVKDLEMVGIKI